MPVKVASYMRACVQRVRRASVVVGSECTGQISTGLVVLLGVANSDQKVDAEYLADKIARLRVFDDDDGKMNRSLLDIGGQMLVVSQFTLYGDCRRGRRPSYTEAAVPEVAESLYDYFVDRTRQFGISVECGRFRAHMTVELLNDGPVTLLLDSSKLY